jgi:hypothetical protein
LIGAHFTRLGNHTAARALAEQLPTLISPTCGEPDPR